jgi:DNA-binding NarL/FixJ family response regulator
MPTNIAAILIVAPAGRVRDSLRVLLKSTRPLIHIEWAEEINRLAATPPTLVLLDASLPNDQAWQALDHIRLHYPQHRCLILAHSSDHQKQAQAAGAQVIRLEGLTAADLFAAVEGNAIP